MIRVGIIDYTNSFPLFYALKNQIIPHTAEFSCGTPVEINEKLQNGALDIALVSSHEFLQNRASYVILSDLGIGATGPVMSVRLFFKETQEAFAKGSRPLLDLQTIYVPSHSATSVRLLKVLCKHFWNVSPTFEAYTDDPKKLFSQDNPFLLIGDQCLKYIDSPTHSSIDLSQAWNEATSKSFTFAVIATRKEAFETRLGEVAGFHQAINESYEWACANIDVIIEHAAACTHCDKSLLKTYYSLLEYRLTENHFNDLEAFAKLAIATCEVPAKGRAHISTKPIVVPMGEERSEQTPSRHEQSAVASFAKVSPEYFSSLEL